jgi:hypothetical protein
LFRYLLGWCHSWFPFTKRYFWMSVLNIIA